MTLWNSSRTVNLQNMGTFMDGSWQPLGNTYNAARGIEWNVSIPTGLPGAVDAYFLDDRIIGTTATGMGTDAATVTSWAISVKPEDEGRLIFNETWTVPSGDLTVVYTDASAEDGVFILSAKENLKYYGFSLYTGKLLWETEPEMYLAFYDKWHGPAYGYGAFFTGRQSGIVTCYNLTTGDVLWTYEVKDKFAEILWSNNWPIGFHFITDGKIYLSYMEHSPINPNGRGAPFVCLNATNGEEIWRINGAFRQTGWGGLAVIGDSIIATIDIYDQRVYAVGKGPSATSYS
jgi:outer membrane protein assembly factor BamB